MRDDEPNSRKVFKVAVAQTTSTYFKKEENQGKVLEIVLQAITKGVHLVLFPEGVNLGYFVLDKTKTVEETLALALKMADSTSSQWLEGLKDFARKGIYIGCGSFLRTVEGKLVNALLLFSPSGEVRAYHKTHLYHAKDAREDNFVTPGDALTAFEFESFTVGASICYDLNFPEVFRALALKGVQIILISSAWPTSAGDVWDILLPARALENQVYVMASNQTGGVYYGHSKVVDFTGKILASMDDEEGFVVAEIDLGRQEKWRNIVTYFGDRRPELYDF